MLNLILFLLAALAAWSLFVLVKPTGQCRKCGGWGNQRKRRRNRACSRCQGTGRAFRPAARLVHRGAALGLRQWRERSERES